MTTSLLIAALTAVMAGVGSFVTWKISKRNASGAIDTSVAADLWAEGGKIRGELRTDLADTKQKLEDTNIALREAVAVVTALNNEIRLSREETRELKAQITALTAQVTELHRAQIEALEQQSARAKELHKEVKTGNGITLGGLADNDETRRILDIPEGERTDHERDHLRTASDRLPADLAADQTKKDTEA